MPSNSGDQDKGQQPTSDQEPTLNQQNMSESGNTLGTSSQIQNKNQEQAPKQQTDTNQPQEHSLINSSQLQDNTQHPIPGQTLLANHATSEQGRPDLQAISSPPPTSILAQAPTPDNPVDVGTWRDRIEDWRNAVDHTNCSPPADFVNGGMSRVWTGRGRRNAVDYTNCPTVGYTPYNPRRPSERFRRRNAIDYTNCPPRGYSPSNPSGPSPVSQINNAGLRPSDPTSTISPEQTTVNTRDPSPPTPITRQRLR
ncbi:hypothetical protein B0T21DRAFT_391187 [Apiosordaria backusii]|uniref:Uncharacterized protein n=1 Tax=Apiosordaria backusii TaxID=314023 RepID=A0AA40K1R6_9PEZI|nr:hypothetical protein B0T21DRAFT_391187 [Apiosordaria backusii]